MDTLQMAAGVDRLHRSTWDCIDCKDVVSCLNGHAYACKTATASHIEEGSGATCSDNYSSAISFEELSCSSLRMILVELCTASLVHRRGCVHATCAPYVCVGISNPCMLSIRPTMMYWMKFKGAFPKCCSGCAFGARGNFLCPE
ncbi:uncharacterized protein LOC135396173 [Ornithodoros turicata]|uniref:uncharacterized protein LOC135396173 n=1 Tax=Ornithodoros turicata TaxID=34597 RepID=UPI003139E2A4